MSHLVEFGLEDGGSILIETQEMGTLVTRGGGQVQERAAESFDRSLSKVKSAADALLASLSGLVERPDEVSVEFGLNFSAEAGAFIGNLGTSANFRVALTWRRNESAG